jgi:thioredoxin 1
LPLWHKFCFYGSWNDTETEVKKTGTEVKLNCPGIRRTILLTEKNFREEVLRSSQPVLVVIATDWSGMSYILEPIIEKLAKGLEPKLKIGRIDVEKNKSVVVQFPPNDIPTLLLFDNGIIIWEHTGLISLKDLLAAVEVALGGIS